MAIMAFPRLIRVSYNYPLRTIGFIQEIERGYGNDMALSTRKLPLPFILNNRLGTLFCFSWFLLIASEKKTTDAEE